MSPFVAGLMIAVALCTPSQRRGPATMPLRKPVATTTATPRIRILFIGDGYTSANGGLGDMVQAMGAADGRKLECASTTSTGKNLDWHVQSGGAFAQIRKQRWDFVVLQESANRAIAEPDGLAQSVRALNVEVTKAGAKSILFIPWTAADAQDQQESVNDAYAKLADELSIPLACVGQAWGHVRVDGTARIGLHGTDGTHPSPAGTYLAAAVVYRTIFGGSMMGLPRSIRTARGHEVNLPVETALLLQNVADFDAIPVVQEPDVYQPYGPRRVVLVLDATGTMLGLKFKILQAEAVKLIDALPPEAAFNVVFFSGGDSKAEWLRPFSPTLQSATDANKAKAREFIRAFNVVGRGTNPLPALRDAFTQRPDLIEFVSDGEFDNVVSYERVKEAVASLNRAGRTRINTTAFMSADTDAQGVMEKLARENGGTFRRAADRNLK